MYFSLLFLGIGSVFPWNAFITAADYFEAKYPVRVGREEFSEFGQQESAQGQ